MRQGRPQSHVAGRLSLPANRLSGFDQQCMPCCCCCCWLQISGVKVYGGPDRLVFYREASTGLSKLAYFWALDTWSYVGARMSPLSRPCTTTPASATCAKVLASLRHTVSAPLVQVPLNVPKRMLPSIALS
jgi:hypothetical protein